MKKLLFVGLFLEILFGACVVEDFGFDPFAYGENSEIRILGFMNEKVNLNGEWLGVNDMIFGEKILKIYKDCVLLQGFEIRKICVKQSRFLEKK